MTKETFKQASSIVELLKELKTIAKTLTANKDAKITLSLVVKNSDNQSVEGFSEELTMRVIEKLNDIKDNLEKEFESL